MPIFGIRWCPNYELEEVLRLFVYIIELTWTMWTSVDLYNNVKLLLLLLLLCLLLCNAMLLAPSQAKELVASDRGPRRKIYMNQYLWRAVIEPTTVVPSMYSSILLAKELWNTRSSCKCSLRLMIPYKWGSSPWCLRWLVLSNIPKKLILLLDKQGQTRFE